MQAAPDLMAPTLSHFWHSLSQLLTRLVGQQMMTRLAMGSPPRLACPDTRSVHSSVMPCSSAMPSCDHSRPQLQAATLPPSIGKACIGVAASPSCDDQGVRALRLDAPCVKDQAHLQRFAQTHVISQDAPCMRQVSQQFIAAWRRLCLGQSLPQQLGKQGMHPTAMQHICR